MGNVIAVENEEDFNQYIEDNDRVVVDFWATWCGPCARFAPHFEKASESVDGVTFLTVDVDKAPWAMADYGVQGVPTVMLFEDGQYAKNIQERTTIRLIGELS